ncbi:FAD-dependent monooxygenase [Niveibacterium terrae]|uniref:FAD-dependent monooxygenase n=1 Tax=Niveibacterium terrae TaxID=3373598 RepID=UPI003A94F844
MKDSVLIVGAGPVGLALALALKGSGLTPTLVDARPAGSENEDQRVLALAHGSRQTLEKLGAWPKTGWTPIEAIHVSQRGGLGRTEIRATEQGLPALGYVCPAATLTRCLAARAAGEGILVEQNCFIESSTANADHITALARDGREFDAQLLACCEGGTGSQETGLIRHDYAQHALIGIVTAQSPHQGVAYERFTPEGPLALLPFGGDFALVWTMSAEEAQRRLALADRAFLAELQNAFGTRARFLAVSGRTSFALALQARLNPVSERKAFLGNAAQTLHPVAGQGFNLALRDVWTLAETLAGAADPGEASLLARYAQARRLDRFSTVGFTDSLVRLFSNDDPLLRHLRGAGLFALDLFAPARKFIARRMIYGARAWP